MTISITGFLLLRIHLRLRRGRSRCRLRAVHPAEEKRQNYLRLNTSSWFRLHVATEVWWRFCQVPKIIPVRLVNMRRKQQTAATSSPKKTERVWVVYPSLFTTFLQKISSIPVLVTEPKPGEGFIELRPTQRERRKRSFFLFFAVK